jgi:hypothetical protein
MRKLALLLAALALGAAFSESASAHGRVVVGVGFGFPLWPAPWYYGGPYPYSYPYYYGSPFVVSSPPATYIERQDAAPAPAAADWWYYCEQSRGYYPYVKTCPTGWQKVPPAPPPG